MQPANSCHRDDFSFGSRLHALRRASNLTLEQLAHSCGRTKAYIWQLERDKARASAAVLMAISRTLGVRAQDLMQPWELPGVCVPLSAGDVLWLNRYLRLSRDERLRCRQLLSLMRT